MTLRKRKKIFLCENFIYVNFTLKRNRICIGKEKLFFENCKKGKKGRNKNL